MHASFNDALCYGYERLAAWAELLDRINVFPIADADTGTNLRISLAPLRWPTADRNTQIRRLMMAATGNSGNIAAAFFAELVKAEKAEDLKSLIDSGRIKARQAVVDPQPGTMLTILEVLAQTVNNGAWRSADPDCAVIIDRMEKAVADTAEMLPVLQQAGVIDAGALGLFIFLEAYFCALFAPSHVMRPVTEIFPDKLIISAHWQPDRSENDYCVNTMLYTDSTAGEVQLELAAHGESMVITGHGDCVKVHLHTRDLQGLRDRLASIGRVTEWAEESMQVDIQPHPNQGTVHILTDAAGSFTREDAKALGVTLLDSYLVVDGRAFPETHFEPRQLYAAMSGGLKVTTAQASLFERQQCYLSATGLHDHIIYLCVGSVYTGNFEAATSWQARQGLADRFVVLDTGAASGRLGLIAMATARYARTGANPARVSEYARSAMARSEELVFLDQLKFLAAGGRISKTKGFFGDLMHFKPVISPRPEGAAKVAVMRHRRDQLPFALDQMNRHLGKQDRAMILLEFSDNRDWVEQTAAPKLKDHFPAAELLIRPLSLTSGAHMGPGTWAVAYLPPIENDQAE